MKKIFIAFFIFIISFCGNKLENHPIVVESFKKKVIKNTFKNYKVDSNKVKESMNKFFKGKNYKVIRILRIKGKKVYFAVQEYYPDKIYRAIKKGAIIQENGKIREVFDTNIGVYNQLTGDKIVDFNKVGIKKGEVSCYVLGFEDERDITYLYLLDKKFNNIFNPNHKKASSLWFTSLGTVFELADDKADENVSLFYIFKLEQTEEDMYKDMIKHYKKYLEGKKKGKTVKSAAVKAEFERLKKAGLVEGM